MIEVFSEKSEKVVVRKDSTQRLVMSDEEYFGNTLPDHISNSKLGLINPEQNGSALRFKKGFADESKSAAFELGSAVHAMTLEKEKYQLSDVSKPSGKVGMIYDTIHELMTREVNPLDFDESLYIAVNIHDYYGGKVEGKRLETLISAGKTYLEFLKELKKPGVISLTEAQRLTVIACGKSIQNNENAQKLLEPLSDDIFPVEVYNEDVFIADIDYTTNSGKVLKMSLKMKADNWSIDEGEKILTLNDLKTTGKSISDFCGRYATAYEIENGKLSKNTKYVKGSFQTYHYYRQMYMYAFLLYQYAREKYGVDETWTFNVNMIVVETGKYNNTQVFSVGTEWLLAGKDEFEQLLERVAFHEINGYDQLMEINRKEIVQIP